VDPGRVTALTRGESYIPDVPSGAQETLQAGRFTATTDPDALRDQDAIVICVPTPLRKSKDPDISHVVSAAEAVAAHLRRGQLVILESTTYPGTTEEVLLPTFQRGGLMVGRDFHLAFSPERIDPGNAQYPVKLIPKLVGGVTPECTRLAAVLYRQIVSAVHELSSPTAAELAKLYENTFRSVNIALANELALICHHLKADVWEVIDAAATKPFGFMPFYPGRHRRALHSDRPVLSVVKARLNGYEAKFIGLADEINRTMPEHILELLTDGLNEASRSVKGSRVLVMGVAYKRGVSDVRESPALEIVEALLHKGADVRYADPFVPSVAVGETTLVAVPADAEVFRWADAALVLTDHREFDYQALTRQVPLIVDARNATRGIPDAAGRVIRL
jgi:UDP-N-acetyl-D-glucosamine dehydrogenase